MSLSDFAAVLDGWYMVNAPQREGLGVDDIEELRALMAEKERAMANG